MTEKPEMEKRREGIINQRLGSKSEILRITSQISAKLADVGHFVVKTDGINRFDVTYGARALFLSSTKIGMELTPRKAELLAYALLEAAKLVDSKTDK